MNLGIGLGVTNYLRVPTVALDPDAAIAALFESGEVGAWYDPSDSATVWQDAAGTTPATVGDPVGRIDDKSGNGNHATQTTSAARPILQQSGATPVLSGTELVTNGTFDTDVSGWTGIACTISHSAGAMRITDTDGAIGYARQPVTVEVGKTYKISADVVSDNITGPMYLYAGTTDGGSNLFSASLSSGTGTLSGTFTASTTTAWVSLRNATAVAGEYWEVDNISIQEVTSWSGGLRYLDFDGVDDSMEAIFSSTQTQPNTIAVAFKQDAAPTVAYVYDSDLNVDRHALLIRNSISTMRPYAGIELVGGPDPGLTDHVSLVHYDGASSSFRFDGALSVSGDVGSMGWSGVAIGSRHDAANGINGRIYSFVGVNRTLTAAEITDLETYLAAKSGVTL